jgi:hypothetical protein
MITKNILGYKYNSEQEVIDAQKLCDEHYGIPVHPDDVTQHWCGYEEAYLNEPIFWFIRYDQSLVVVLGEPIDFEVNFPE